MPRVANRFTNPKTGAIFDWPINHNEESANGKQRNIEHSSPTSGLGLIRQQGDNSPTVLKWQGTILVEAQNVAMWSWFQLSGAQSIYLRDFQGYEYEGFITAYNPTRKRAMDNPRGRLAGTNPGFYYTYELEFEVIRFIAGPMYGVTP